MTDYQKAKLFDAHTGKLTAKGVSEFYDWVEEQGLNQDCYISEIGIQDLLCRLGALQNEDTQAH